MYLLSCWMGVEFHFYITSWCLRHVQTSLRESVRIIYMFCNCPVSRVQYNCPHYILYIYFGKTLGASQSVQFPKYHFHIKQGISYTWTHFVYDLTLFFTSFYFFIFNDNTCTHIFLVNMNCLNTKCNFIFYNYFILRRWKIWALILNKILIQTMKECMEI